jgi:tRNA threonylcarbamoyladenosine biosynthesis protein TsaB
LTFVIFVGKIASTPGDRMILALDATSEYCSAALSVNGHLLSRSLHAPREHTQMLLSFVDELLKEGNISLKDLDAIAFGAGPGSFTGLRIAAAMAQGLAFGANKPVVPISSLRAMADEAHEQTGAEQVMVALDARKNEVYWALYRWDDHEGMKLVQTEEVLLPSEVSLPDHLNEWVAVGNGFQVYHAAFETKLSGEAKSIHPDIMPQATAIARCAIHDLAQGKAVDAHLALPTYIRDNVV